MRTAIVSLLLLAATVGCGSAAQAPLQPSNSAPAASAGDESSPEPPVAAEASGDPATSPEPIPSRATGPATLTVVASLAGQPIQANVLVLDEQGEHKAEATTGAPITVPAGSYKLEIAITDAAVMVDKPTQVRELRLEPGQSPRVEARFSWAKVQLDVQINGRSQPGATVQLLRNGEVVAQMKSGARPVAITPGRYEADVLLKGAKIRVTGLLFPDSATQTVPVNVRM